MGLTWGSGHGVWLHTENGILLIFSRTETVSWQKDIWPHADAILFPHGRVHFYTPDGIRYGSGTAPSSLLAYGTDNVVALRTAGIAGALVLRAEMLAGDKATSF